MLQLRVKKKKNNKKRLEIFFLVIVKKIMAKVKYFTRPMFFFYCFAAQLWRLLKEVLLQTETLKKYIGDYFFYKQESLTENKYTVLIFVNGERPMMNIILSHMLKVNSIK
jgi:hypothetical protein